MTEAEIRRRRKERKRKARAKRHRIVIYRRIAALLTLVVLVSLIYKGVRAVAGLLRRGDEVSLMQQGRSVSEDEPVDGYSNMAQNIDIADLDINDEIGLKLVEYADEYPEVKIILRDRDEYPDEIIDMFFNNTETLQFILDYPKNHYSIQNVQVDLPKNGEIPLFIQWDEMWGYNAYGNNIIAISGCGPTSLSMVAIALLKDTTYTPDYIARFSQEHGYCTSVGTDWMLMSEGAAMLGLTSEMVDLSEEDVAGHLADGHPIICSMGPGDFTKAGHFIVLTGYEDGYVTVNDPYSIKNSSKKWKFSDIESQIKNIWAFSV